MRVEFQPAYVLHTRLFRESSLLVDVLTENYGRVALVARGVRSEKKPTQRYHLQPFIPLQISWSGNSSLKTLTDLDPVGPAVFLERLYLYSGFYVNELLMNLLLPEDPAQDVYQNYQVLLHNLDSHQPLEASLRCFEFRLLEILGYGIDFTVCANSGSAIENGKTYCFVPDQGFLTLANNLKNSYPIVSGNYLLAIAANNFADIEVRRAAKRLSRLMFEHLLQGKTLKSRELFLSVAENKGRQ